MKPWNSRWNRSTATEPGPHLLITGGVHGDEFEPMAAIRRLIGPLRAGRIRGRVTLVPVVNEPAFRRGQRTAEDGLDLARTLPGRPMARSRSGWRTPSPS